jgi:filamentous hemagglutinin family protein
MALLLAAGSFARANPTGGAVAAGSATIAGEGSPTVTINQASNTAIINWQTFSIGGGELTKFVQPSSTSAALNRVLGGQTSFINGTLSANGQIYLLNGNGIVVGPGGTINTAGFTGSTRDISDSDFLSGNLHFVGSGKAGVKNLGTIDALGGDVVLIGHTVDNRGTINAAGTAGLIAGDDVLLAQKNADGSTITVDPVSSAGGVRSKVGVKNTGVVNASSAELKAANGNLYALAIQNEGVVRATTVTQQGGHIYLTADSGTIVNSGTLDASATVTGGKGGTVLVKSTSGKVVHSGKIVARGGQGGVGGNAEVSGAQLEFTGQVDLTAPGGMTGNLLLDPSTLTVVAGTGGTVDTLSAGNDQNDSGPSTIGADLVDATLNTANLTLNADTNITVSSAITWNSANTLTLSTNSTAGTSIAINAAITDNYTGAGGLTIHTRNFADPISATAAISVANFILANGQWVQNVAPNSLTGASQLPAFTASHDFEIQGGTFLRASGGNGSSTPYQIVDVYGLQGINGYLSSNFTIGPNPSTSGTIDASSTATWNGGAGFVPLGTSDTPYTGTLTGGTINNLTINLPDTEGAVGLFGYLGSSGSIYYLNLNSATITGGSDVGAFVGDNLGLVYNTSFNSGTVTGTTNVGFIVGNNQNSIQYCYVNGGTATGTSLVGGIAGLNDTTLNGITPVINGSNSGGTVNGTSEVGGIAGENDSSLVSDTGNATVNGQTQVGGVAGLNTSSGTLLNAIGSATVTGTGTADVASTYVGGLVGENDGSVSGSNTTSNSNVSGENDVGGLVGFNSPTGTITDTVSQASFNSGTVSGNPGASEGGGNDIGGVAGLNEGTISDSYNSGLVTGAFNVGGVVGENESTTQNNGGGNNEEDVFHVNLLTNQPGLVVATVQTSYNSGTVSSGSNGSAQNLGGIAGANDSGSVINTCYNLGAIGDGNSASVGGTVGTNLGTIEYTYDSGSVNGSGNVGGLVGFDQQGVAEYSYWDVTTSGQTVSTGALADATETALIPLNVPDAGPSPYSDSSYANFEQDSGGPTLVAGTNGVYAMGTSPDTGGGPAWYIIDGQTRPLLAMEQSGNIQNAHQLQLIAENLSESYNIGQSFSASGTTNSSEIWNSSGFVPIGAQPGDSSYAFTGSLYGEYFTVDSLTISRAGTDDVGLFGYNAGTISYLSLSTLSVTGNNDVGAFAGQNVGSISNVQAGNTFDTTSTIIGFGTGIGGIVGVNGTTTGGPIATLSQDVNYAKVQGGQSDPPSDLGGIAGENEATGIVTQSINDANIGSSFENNVGGLVGDNLGQVDNSYSADSTASVTISGNQNVGGLVGLNGGTLESSYSTGTVSGIDPTTTGALVGTNNGSVLHTYWENNSFNSDLPGIGSSGEAAISTDVVGYSYSQLTNMAYFAQGTSSGRWDFSPQSGEGGGIWGVNVSGYDYLNGQYVQGALNSGLPVLQWQVPVSVEVSLAGPTVPYGTAPTYTATGSGASSLLTSVNSPNGPTLTLGNPGDLNAGSTHTVTFSGTPSQYGYNVEYVNGSLTYDSESQTTTVNPTLTVVPAPLDVTADSYTIPEGGMVPTPTATFGPFAYGETISDLTGTLGFTISPSPQTAPGTYTITPGGLTSTNYAINFISGTLTILGMNVVMPPSQPVTTVQSQVASVTNQFGNNPFNGIDPVYFLSIPTFIGVGGESLGAENTEGNPSDYIYVSSSVSFPALSKLVTPGTGVVVMGDGFVVVGDPHTGSAIYLNEAGHGLPQAVVNGLQSVLSPSVFTELRGLIYGHY